MAAISEICIAFVLVAYLFGTATVVSSDVIQDMRRELDELRRKQEAHRQDRPPMTPPPLVDQH